MDLKFDQVIDDLNRRMEFGVILPSLIIPDLLADLEHYTGIVESHPYYKAFSSKINQISNLKSADRQALQDQARTAIKENVIPAYKSLRDTFKKLEPSAPDDVGVWRYSNGGDYYAYLLRHYTTTDLTADPPARFRKCRAHPW